MQALQDLFPEDVGLQQGRIEHTLAAACLSTTSATTSAAATRAYTGSVPVTLELGGVEVAPDREGGAALRLGADAGVLA